MTKIRRKKPNSSNRKGRYRAAINKKNDDRKLAKNTGREWSDHKYIEKRISKNGKTVYIYDGAGTSGQLGGGPLNVMESPSYPGIYYVAKRNERDFINTDVEKAKNELAKKQIGRGIEDLKTAISDKDAKKAMDAASTTAEGIGSFLDTSIKSLAGPAWNTVQEGIGFIKDIGSVLNEGVEVLQIPDSTVETFVDSGIFLHR